ncbi:unnamed protein product [Urochloa humidicola]
MCQHSVSTNNLMVDGLVQPTKCKFFGRPATQWLMMVVGIEFQRKNKLFHRLPDFTLSNSSVCSFIVFLKKKQRNLSDFFLQWAGRNGFRAADHLVAPFIQRPRIVIG